MSPLHTATETQTEYFGRLVTRANSVQRRSSKQLTDFRLGYLSDWNRRWRTSRVRSAASDIDNRCDCLLVRTAQVRATLYHGRRRSGRGRCMLGGVLGLANLDSLR